MWQDWIYTGWLDVGMVLVSTAALYLAIILYTRLAGLRSFAKMSAFDFAMTVAVGSLFATAVVSKDPTLLLSLVAFAGLFGGQWLIGYVRKRSQRVRWILDNDPVLLMVGDRVLHDHLRATQITEEDLRAKLRVANVLTYDQVRAVVLETTGDISVLHTTDPAQKLDAAILEGVGGTGPLLGKDWVRQT
jgi:uncharacterized membrane protein YcaP (DUF421 family)